MFWDSTLKSLISVVSAVPYKIHMYVFFPEVDKQTFEVCKLQFHKFLGLICYCNFFAVLVRKCQIHKFANRKKTAQLCLKTVLKAVFIKWFFTLWIWIGALYVIFAREKVVLQTFKAVKKTWVRKSQIHKSTNYRFTNRQKNL